MIELYFNELEKVLHMEEDEQCHEKKHGEEHILSKDVNHVLQKDKTNIWLHAVHDTLNKQQNSKRAQMRRQARQLTIQDFEVMTDIAIVDCPKLKKDKCCYDYKYT